MNKTAQKPTSAVAETQKGAEGISLLTFWEVLRERIIWLVLAVAIGVGAMFGYTKLLVTPTYSCSATFWIQIVTAEGSTSTATYNNSYMQGASKLAGNYVEVVKGNLFLNQYIAPAYEELKPFKKEYKSKIEELKKRLEAEEITTAEYDKEYNKCTEEYNNQKNDLLRLVQERDKKLKNELTAEQINAHMNIATAEETVTFTIRITDSNPETAYSLLECFEEIIPDLFNDLDSGYGVSTLRFKLINKGAQPTVSSFASVAKRNMMLGGAAAFILTYLVFFLITVFDRTIYDEETIKSNFDMPVMGQIPQWLKPGETSKELAREARELGKEAEKTGAARPAARDYGERLLTAKTPFSITEAFKTLRTNMMYAGSTTQNCPVWGITSDFAGAGKSIVISNVAASFAMLDKKVLLIDGDMRCPVQHKIFGFSRHRNGLSEGLAGIVNDPIAECIVNTKYPGLDLIVCGRIPPNPGELLASERMQKLLDEARTIYDYIFIDLPPITETADAGVLAPMIDNYLLVIRAGYSNLDASRDAVQLLTSAHANVVGFVLNEIDSRGGSRYSHYGNNKYKYSYRYGRYKYRYRRYNSYDVSAKAPEVNEYGTDLPVAEEAPAEKQEGQDA